MDQYKSVHHILGLNSYAANFEVFLSEKKDNEPFCFWYGATEPHRRYQYHSGIDIGNKKLADIDKVPAFWPDIDSVRVDMLDTFGLIAGAEKYAGYEYLSVVRDSKGRVAATLLVQVPDNFNSEQPCIIAAPSSGSRGVYGAIGLVGPWALKRACALAYTDKGTGTGVYFIDTGESYDIQGRLNRHSGEETLFSPRVSPGLSAYNKTYPHRIALKHAHSQTNVERYWPDFLLQAIRFAFQVINENRPKGGDFTPENTLVIASGTSNGGGTAIRAAENDLEGLIDAVVAAQPNLNLPKASHIRIEQAGEEAAQSAWKLIEYATFINLYLPCAVLSDSLSAAPFYQQLIPPMQPLLEARCHGLHRLGLLKATQLKAQSAEAMQNMQQIGVLPDTHRLDASFLIPRIWEAVSAVYISAYGRFSVDEHPCGISFAAVDDSQGEPVKMRQEMRAKLAAISPGIVGSGGISMIADTAQNGPVEIYRSIDANKADLSLTTALCWRRLLTTPSVQAGMKEIEVNADLHGKPAIIVHGRHDNLVHVNHSSRPYYALNKSTQRQKSRLHYYEIENAQHFDRLLDFPEVAQHYVPLQYYLEQALTRMYQHLTQDKALPSSQLIRTRPARFPAQPLPAISQSPEDDAILFEYDTLIIP